jgi:dihydroflavonol-4-reductase
LPLRTAAEAIARDLAGPVPVPHLPVRLARKLASLLEALPLPPEWLPLTQDTLNYMVANWWFDGRRARDELGFEPRVSLYDGLERTLAWGRQENLL